MDIAAAAVVLDNAGVAGVSAVPVSAIVIVAVVVVVSIAVAAVVDFGRNIAFALTQVFISLGDCSWILAGKSLNK